MKSLPLIDCVFVFCMLGTSGAFHDAFSSKDLCGQLPIENVKLSISNSKELKQVAKSVIYKSHFMNLELINGRKVYIDGGSRDYRSSIHSWFLEQYPQSHLFNNIFAFEVESKYLKTYQRAKFKSLCASCSLEVYNLAVWDKNTTIDFLPEGKDNMKMSSIMVGISGISAKQIERKRSVNAFKFSEFLLNHFTLDDFVVVKLDIEGAEYAVVEDLLASDALPLIDEIFIEWHYVELQGSVLGKGKSRSDATDLIMKMRGAGCYAHDWN
mmetsp:Transcript_25255/g.79853  ORF Transcript_25255/g.79853 Transcript_25255/m.79853 type:complete len:268 (+) Transcript_25255:148-951(+)